MSEKRRDNRGRILRNGESQRQDGRYAYKYKDLNGDTKFVYSWRLDKNDRTPPGKAREPSLREKEKKIQQDLFNQEPRKETTFHNEAMSKVVAALSKS